MFHAVCARVSSPSRGRRQERRSATARWDHANRPKARATGWKKKLASFAVRSRLLPMALPIQCVAGRQSRIVARYENVFGILVLRGPGKVETACDDRRLRPVGINDDDFVMSILVFRLQPHRNTRM